MAFNNHKRKRGKLFLCKIFYTMIAIIFMVLVLIKGTKDNNEPDQIKTAVLNLSTLAPPIDIGRKEGTHVIFNIGSNLDPIVPRPNDDPCTIALAFEPIVGHLIPVHPALHVIPAAVAPEGGWATMNLYNKDGRSSSLSKASFGANWNKNSKLKVVPLISFRTILDSLRNYEIDLILTDMQGHDFASVSSVEGYLAETGVKRLITEVYKDSITTYKGANNDLCKDWLPHMTSIGYVFEGLTQMVGDTETLIEGYRNDKEVVETCKRSFLGNAEEKAGLSEFNAFWRLKSEPTVGRGVEAYQYGTHSSKQQGHTFSNEDYAKCI